MFLQVPDADYVVCRDGTVPPLASTAFVRCCHSAWEVVFTSTTLGEFVDRLGAFDAGLLFHTYGSVEELFDRRWGGAGRDDPFGGASEVAGHGFPMAEGNGSRTRPGMGTCRPSSTSSRRAWGCR